MEDDPTPRPRKKDSWLPDTEGNETSSDEEPFQTPLTRLRRKRFPTPNSPDLSGPVAKKKQVGMTKGKARAATKGVEMLRNHGDNYATNEEKSSDLAFPSDSESTAMESDLRVVDQRKASSKCVAERKHASSKEHRPLAVDKFAHRHVANIGDSNTCSYTVLVPKNVLLTLTTQDSKHPEPAGDPSFKHTSKVTTKEPMYDRASKSTSRAITKEPAYDHIQIDKEGSYTRTTEPAYDHAFKSTSRATTKEPTYDRASKSTSRATTKEPAYNHIQINKEGFYTRATEPAYNCTSKSTRSAAMPELGYEHTFEPPTRAVVQEPVYDHPFKATSRTVMQEAVYHCTSRPTSRAATQEPVYNRPSKLTRPELGYDRTSEKVTLPEHSSGHPSKPASRVPVQELEDHATNLKWAGRAAPREPVSDHEHFIGWSEEDDTRDREAAMLSPLKGSELRAEAKFIKVKEPEAKSRKRASIQDLPEGANNDSAWTH